MAHNVSDTQTGEDLDLARAAAAGDGSAFDELYRAHADAAWRVAFAVTGNRDDAADAVADAFTRFLAALTAGRLADLANVRAYLLTTTRNAAIDVLRRNGRLQPLDDLPQAEMGSLSAGPSDRVVDGLDAAFVSTAFLSLPERWRSVLWLTEVEGMSAADVAILMGVSANNAAQLAVRARAGLKAGVLSPSTGWVPTWEALWPPATSPKSTSTWRAAPHARPCRRSWRTWGRPCAGWYCPCPSPWAPWPGSTGWMSPRLPKPAGG